MLALASHPQRNTLRLQLRQNQLLQGMSAAQWAELEPQLAIADYRKGEPLVRQGDDLGSQAQTLAAILAAAGAVHAWGDAASGARALPGGYKLFSVPDAAGWLRVELSVSLLLPWR